MKKQVQLHFERYEKCPGKYKTGVSVVLNDDYSTVSRRGIIHKAVDLKDNITGDVPSFRKFLDRQSPQTLHGKATVFTAKAGTEFVRQSAKLTVNTGLAAETMALSSKDGVKAFAMREWQNRFYRETSDDSSRSLRVSADFTRDVVSGSINRYRQKSRYTVEKNRLAMRRSEKKQLADKNRKALNERKAVFKRAEEKYKNAQKLKKSNVNRALTQRRREAYLESKEELGKFRRSVRSSNWASFKRVHYQKKSVRLNRPTPLVLTPLKYGTSKALFHGWMKAAYEDSDNDLMRSVNFGVQTVQMSKAFGGGQNKLRSTQRKEQKAEKRTYRSQGKLKERDSKLSQKSSEKKKNKKRRKKSSKKKESISSRILSALKDSFTTLGGGMLQIAKSVAATASPILIFVVILLFALLLLMSVFQGIFSNSAFVLGTYTAKDNELSDAEIYYTEIAYEMNEYVMMCGTEDWEKGLKKLGVDTKQMKDDPDEFIFGYSDMLPYDVGYDFDPFKLWSFLCAFKYEFGEDEDENDEEDQKQKYWEFDKDCEDVVDKLFKEEYSFEYNYDNTSRWEELNNYTFEGGIDGSYWLVDSTEVYADKIKPISNPQALNEFKDKNGYLHFNFASLEIINVNDDNNYTGWYLQDQRYIVTDPSGTSSPPFYSKSSDNYAAAFGREYDGVWYDKSFFGYPDNELFFVVAPVDTQRWRSDLENTCLVSYYQSSVWKEDCRLYYTVHQKCIFDEAIRKLLGDMEYGEQRLEYYDILDRGTEGDNTLLGNHQSIVSPVNFGVNSMLENNRIYNGYGWDMRAWNTTHCSLDATHFGIDLKADSGCDVYAMVDGKIDSIDTDLCKVVIKSTEKVDLWYDKERKFRVTYYNVNLDSTLEKGDEITAGDKIGTFVDHKYCEECDSHHNDEAGVFFLHIKFEIYYGVRLGWECIDPRLLITLNDLEEDDEE